MSNTSVKTKAEIIRIRKRRKLIVGGVILAFLSVIALTVLAFVFCRVEAFTVKGEFPYTQDEIKNTLTPSTGRSMFTVDTEELAKYIETILPLTDGVTITKKFPKTLSVKAGTAKKVYAVELSEKIFAVTNEKLKMLEAVSAVPSGAIPVECSGISTYELGKTLNFNSKIGDDPAKTVLTEIYTASENEELKNISIINVRDLNSIYLIYDGRILVRLGDSANIPEKISLAKKSIDEENKLSPAQYGILDLTISKKAVFSPDDLKDIPEVQAYLEKAEYLAAAEEESQEEAGAATPTDTDAVTVTDSAGEADNPESGDTTAVSVDTTSTNQGGFRGR